MTFTPQVSVIVPIFNGEKTVDACVDSLLHLDYPQATRELIFVDNASTDQTAKILESYGDRIRVAFEPKRGPAAARNRGLHAARHEIVAMTDADCVADRLWLRRLVEPLRDSSVGLVGGTILSKQPCNAIERFGEQIHDHRSAIEKWIPPHIITMNWASRKSLVSELRFFDDSFLRCEDVDLSYRVYQAGYKFSFAPEAIVRHQNEKTYAGLFLEGYRHGFFGVQNNKKHRTLLATVGHRKIFPATYAALFTSLRESLRRGRQSQARCDFTFNAAKKLGKIVGSIRFGFIDL